MAIEYSKEGKIAFIVINRPETGNALDQAALKEMNAALVDFEHDPALLAGVITGAGEVFCSGLDIRSLSPDGEQPQRDPSGAATLMRGLEITKPLIAAINGTALGGGLELVLCCDLRLAVPAATFGFPEVTLGLIPGWGGTQRLPRQLPWCLAARLLLTGHTIDAEEALRTGLINRIVPPSDIRLAAREWAEDICRNAPLAVKAAKEAMQKGWDLSLDEGLALEDALVGYLKTSRDFKEGLAAFNEKRRPSFRGI